MSILFFFKKKVLILGRYCIVDAELHADNACSSNPLAHDGIHTLTLETTTILSKRVDGDVAVDETHYLQGTKVGIQ